MPAAIAVPLRRALWHRHRQGQSAATIAYALGLKATGLTFYDDEVIDFFGDAAKGYDVMFLIAIGR